MSEIRIRDKRRKPFFMVDKAAYNLIVEVLKPSEIMAAKATYSTLVHLANNNQSDEFTVKRATIAKLIGRTPRSVDTYLGVLINLGLIEKNPIAVNNEYRYLSIEILTPPEMPEKPISEVLKSASTPPTLKSTATPVEADCDTSSNPLQNDIKESPKERISSSNTATAAPPLNIPSADAESSVRAQRNGSGDVRVNAPAKKSAPSAKRVQPEEDSSYLSLVPPGSGADLEETQQGRKKIKKPRKIRGGDPDKNADEWDAYDALAYFKRKWGKTFPGEIMPERKAHIPRQVNGRIAWLKIEKHPAGAMKRVIDHIFDNWQDGLADKIKWDGSRPAYGIIASTWYFEKVFRLVEYGPTGKPRHDAYDAEAAKRAEEVDDGWRK
jgi:hypothetical protein